MTKLAQIKKKRTYKVVYLRPKQNKDMTTLIADSGSTKTNWLLISNNGKIEKYQTEGINPVVGDSTLISNTIGKVSRPT